jgi:hypothetical protein
MRKKVSPSLASASAATVMSRMCAISCSAVISGADVATTIPIAAAGEEHAGRG